MNCHFNLCPDCDSLKLYTEISSLTRIFHDKGPVTGSRVSFLENRGSIKTIKERGQRWIFFKIRILLITRLLHGPKYAKLRLAPQNRWFSKCILRQTATLAGSNDRIDLIYFLYRDVFFLAGKKSCFFGSPGCVRLLQAARDRFYKKKRFYDKKSGIRESRVRRGF